jgi:hypothetical protein
MLQEIPIFTKSEEMSKIEEGNFQKTICFLKTPLLFKV